MAVQELLNFVPAFVLAFFRLAGLMLASPLFGSAKIPRRVQLLFASVAAMGMISAIPRDVVFPPTLIQLTFAIGGELVFGLAMGLIVSFTFFAAQWAGEMIGQQIGFNMSEVFDPQFGQAGSLVGDLYFMLTLVIFLTIGGHRTLVQSVHQSFLTLPLMSVTMNADLFDTFMALFTSATTLAMRMAAPMFCTMLVVDLAMGCIGKAMPQMNIMTAGLPMRAIIGLLVLWFGIYQTGDVLAGAVEASLRTFSDLFTYPIGGVADGG